MGYRNPITTASEVDTGRGPSDAGVRLYQDTSVPAVPVGVAEWRTGTMTRNATAKLSGGGSGGSVFAINGGSTQGIDSPDLELDVEALAAGGYGPLARLRGKGGRALTDTPWLQDTTYSPLSLVAAFVAFDTNNVPRYGRLSNGEVQLEGIAKLNSGTIAAGASATVGNLPAALVPGMNIHRPILILTSAATYFAAGWLVISAGATGIGVFNTSSITFNPGASFSLGCNYAPATSLTP